MTLPKAVASLVEDWDLTPDGAPTQGRSALVVPVLTAGGQRCVLKVGSAPAAADHEALALKLWHGRGAVRLISADPHRSALLLERLEDVDLHQA